MSKVKIKNNKEKIANILLSIGCVNINFKKKFTLTSGKKSPVYVDSVSYTHLRAHET